MIASAAAGLIDGLNGVAGVGKPSAGTAAGAAGGPPFSGMLHSMMEQTTTLDAKASEAVTGLLSGQGVEVHDALIATQKADVAFQLALQVRNKAVAAYQQMMAMQF